MIDDVLAADLMDVRVDQDGQSARGVEALADEVRELAEQVTELTGALASNRRIGMAMGIVIKQLDVGEQEAFDALRRISQDTNRKLRDVAEDVIRHRRL